ncbi:MAG: hypothetical protein JWQ51_731 [Tardiphaga sp.]|nr:hypothetical protein [Tardiphaga sp.]
MADDRPPNSDDPSDDAGPDIKRSKRPAPTLDLSATEIPRASAPAAPVSAADDAPAGDPAPEPARARPPSTILIPALAGAAAAALVMILISLAGWPVGAPTQDVTPAAPANPSVLNDLTARLARLEARPAASPTPPPVAAPVTPLLTPRIDALDKAVAALRDDVAATRARGEQALAAVGELKAAPPVAPPPDLSAITARLSQLESAVKTQAASAQQVAKPADDAPLRHVVAASLLDMQVRQNQPYAAALKLAASGADAARTQPLDRFAATGVPTAATLSNELLGLLPKLTPAPAAATTGSGLIDRLQAGAARLVKIERGDASGVASTAIVTRAADAAKRNDLVAARRELAALPPADKAVVQPWIDRTEARDAALAASQQLASDAMAALAKPAP